MQVSSGSENRFERRYFFRAIGVITRPKNILRYHDGFENGRVFETRLELGMLESASMIASSAIMV
jgi:hypothetical protein